MICDISNAYPSNGTCVDANDRIPFSFTFCGDHTIGWDADYFYADTGIELSKGMNDRGYYTDGYYNGEHTQVTTVTNFFEQDTKYLWRARVYSKIIDIANGEYPDILVTRGEVLDNPIIKTTVAQMSSAFAEQTPLIIALTGKHDIPIPSYIFIGDETRKIVSYDSVYGVITIDKELLTYPEVGTEVTINKMSDNNLSIEDDSLVVFINPNTTIIQPAKYYRSVTDGTAYHAVYLKINDEYIPIIDHDIENGILTLESAFGTTPVAGDTYEVYCNFIDSPFYNFETKAKPVITPTVELWTKWNMICFKCNASMTTNTSDVYIKSYHWEIYKTPISNEGEYVLSEESEEIYSGRMEYMARIIDPEYKYMAKIVATTNEGVIIEAQTEIVWSGNNTDGIKNLTSYFDIVQNRCVLKWENITNNISYTILRTNSVGYTEYLETIIGNVSVYYDYKATNRETYTYTIIPKTDVEICNHGKTSVSTDFNNMSLYFLSEVKYEVPPEYISAVRTDTNLMYEDAQYRIEKSYSIELNFKDIEITHNIKRDIQISHNGMPIVTVGQDNYDSFPLEFTFGNVKCIDGKGKIDTLTQQDYLEWRSYIASGLPVVVKDIIGNIWFGTITEHNPKTDTQSNIYMYHINLNFTQSRNIDKTRILTD